MSLVRLDFFPAHDLNGTSLFTMTEEDDYFMGIELRPELGRLGGGVITLHRRVGDAMFDNGSFQPEVFVRVNIPQVDPTKYIWGFFLDLRKQVLIAEQEGQERFVLGGPGPLFYLSRAILWDEQFSGSGFAIDRDNGVFDFDGDDNAGQILIRLFNEDAANTLATFLPDLTYDFTGSDDSAGAAWSDTVGSGFSLPIGASYLEHLWSLQDAISNLDVTVDLGDIGAPTYEMRAWQALGVDRSTASFAAGKIYLKEGENLEPSLEVTGTALRKATHALVRGRDGEWGRSAPFWDPGEYARAVMIDYPNSNSTFWLNRAGERFIKRQINVDQEFDLVIRPGFDELNGYYFPGPFGTNGHFWYGDTVTIDTGAATSTPLDFADEEHRVTGFRLELREAAVDDSDELAALSWNVVVNLNHERGSDNGLGSHGDGSGAAVGPHNHPPNPRLCSAGETISAIETGTDWKMATAGTPVGWHDAGFDDSAYASAVNVNDPAGNWYDNGSDIWVWSNQGDRPSSEERAFREEFTLSAVPSAASVQVASDFHASVYINGTLVVDDHTGFATAQTYSIDPSEFVVGANCISIEGLNGGSTDTPAGVYAVLTVTAGDDPLLIGTSNQAARCDHNHLHNDLLGRSVQAAHPASATSYDGSSVGSTATDVQARLDELSVPGVSSSITHAIHGRYVATFHRDSDRDAYLLLSDDGITWTDPKGSALFTPVATSGDARDPSFTHFGGYFWLVQTGSEDATADGFDLWRSENLLDWTHIDAINIEGTFPSATAVWAPEFIRNSDGTPYLNPSTGFPGVVVAIASGGTGSAPTDFELYEMHATSRDLTTWSAPTEITGTGLPAEMIDGCLVYVPEFEDGTPWKLWYKDEVTKHIEYAASASMTSGYTVIEDGNWAGWKGANSIEGPNLVKLEDGRWRIYFNENDGFDSVAVYYSDSTDDWATWTTKAAIVAPYLMSHGTVLFIPSAYDHARDPDAHATLLDSLVTDHGELTGLADDDHTHYLNESRHDALDHSDLVSTLIAVDTGSVAYDTSTPGEVGITVTSNWGHDGTNAYYDDTGATAGEEAALYWDPATGQYAVITFDF